MIRRPPRSTLFPTRRSSDLPGAQQGGARLGQLGRRGAAARLARQADRGRRGRSEEHTSELQSRRDLVCRLLLEKKKKRHQATRVAETTWTNGSVKRVLSTRL